MERPGVIDDGCVFGYPGEQGFSELLDGDRHTLADAYQRALASPVEIIVEFETRLCAPIVPSVPVPARVGTEWVNIEPAMVRGTDEGAALPSGADALSAAIGVAAVFGGTEDGKEHVGYTLACLWRTPEAECGGLSVGPAVVTPEELDRSSLTVTASVEDKPLATASVDDELLWTDGRRSSLVAVLPAQTRLLTPGEELFLDGGPLGEFEVRIGSAV
ncbi:FAA hydrolase family protein [Haloactinospora alba]|nr:hypothetical protein [Haloactinospora alba]